MMIVGFLLIKSLLILLALPAGYLLMSTIASYFFKKEEPISNQFLNIGVLIPAHNEEEGIKRTIENILGSDYPANRFELFVIADNCTDSTATNAREAGAQVFERFNELKRGKGEALDWFLKNCKENYQATNAITIIDADVCPDKNYLREISASLSNPEIEAVQAFNGVSNPQAGWRTALIDAAFNVFNHLRMAGSFRMSGSAILRGNGMGFRTELLEHYGWPSHSIVEDIEFTLILLKDGINIHYNPDAVIRSEMVTSAKNASSQRNRWEGGRFMLVKNMSLPLLRLFKESRDFRYLYALAELAIPPLSILVMLFTLATVGSIALDAVWQFLAASFWAILLVYLASGQIQRRASLSTWLYLATAPLYVLWKIPIYMGMMLKNKTNEWVRTTRETSNKSSNC